MQRFLRAISLEPQVQIAIGTLLVVWLWFGFTLHELFFATAPCGLETDCTGRPQPLQSLT